MKQHKYTCTELGACQSRIPPCPGCWCNHLDENRDRGWGIPPPAKPVPTKPAPEAKPRTVWAFAIAFDNGDLIAAALIVALAYFCAGYFG
jgi:hypothetical protein